MWIFWVLWILIGGAVEIWAAMNKKKDDTLSEQVWRFDGMLARWPWLRIPFHMLLAGFLIVLIPHFLHKASL